MSCHVFLCNLCHSLGHETVPTAVLVDVIVCIALAGYTVSSVIIGDWRKLYIAGAPRFRHKGKVILFDLTDDGDVTIFQALNGEQVEPSGLPPSPPPTPGL